ncbi:MAG: type II toxin-antitoxin system HicB family antitoxin [Woronichinia naegeliana WA131]|jgi:predicted RNase H-like HicB family nuclease|uniref:Type II toxin-antitoxin system HicB family antitoxin n=1 Tax=Woronichinia naegeliana WA131 TaxID=2824559 RepID=A0A977KV58_9CYAN|nr:MAG: type II toxin-antitoxin system HicB family antitoxin [Woronichinia naegeliana WA131]
MRYDRVRTSKRSVIYLKLMESKKIYNYTVLLEREEDGGYHAFCPILKGCHSQGDTFEQAIDNITEAIELYVESLLADHQPIPQEDLIVKSLSIFV